MMKKIIENTRGVKYYQMVKYTTIPFSNNDIYIISTVGDTLMSLAVLYYKDPSLWKLISIANKDVIGNSVFPIPGTQLRIPIDISNEIERYN